MFSFQIDKRSIELGGGWQLRLIEDSEEVGGAVFPLAEYEADSIEVAERLAYMDAYSTGTEWLCSREMEQA